MPTYMDVIDRMADAHKEKVMQIKALKKENRLLKKEIKRLKKELNLVI